MNISPCFLLPFLALAPLAAGAGEASTLTPALPAEEGPATRYGLHDGRHVLWVQGRFPNYVLCVYAREGETYVRKHNGEFRLGSCVLEPDFAASRLDDKGLTIVLRRRSANGSSELELTHRFDFLRPQDSFEFLNEPGLAEAFLHEFEGKPGGFIWSAPLSEKHRREAQAPAAAPAPQGEAKDWAALYPLPQLDEGEPDSCVAHSVTLPNGRQLVNVLQTGGFVDSAAPQAAALPDNRVTRALRRAVPRLQLGKGGKHLPGWIVADNELPGRLTPDDDVRPDQLLELCYLAPYWVDFCHDWFCDATGDNLVFVGSIASGAVTYDMLAYRWDEAKQAFVPRGRYYYCSRVLFLDPARVEFDDKGICLHLSHTTKDGATTLHFRHHFDDDAEGADECRFIAAAGELADAYSDDLETKRLARDLAATPYGQLELATTTHEGGFTLAADGRIHRVAAGGELFRLLSGLLERTPAAQAATGSPAPLPDNRVTRHLNSEYAWMLGERNAGLTEPGPFVTEKALFGLWVYEQNRLQEDDMSAGWFCDEAGENLVIVGYTDDDSACELNVYTWDAARQGFVERGQYWCNHCGLPLNPAQVEFGVDRIRVPFLFPTAEGTIETEWREFPYTLP